MDSMITAAALALAKGDPFGALNQVALRDDAPALALRGIAMAQLGDLVRARDLVKSAARAFGRKEPVASARCVVAEAEIALASRELNWPVKKLVSAQAILQEHGDGRNAAYARYLVARRLLLIGQLDQADRTLAALVPTSLPQASRAGYHLVAAGIAMRRIQARKAHAALAHALAIARRAQIPALIAEVEDTVRILDANVARSIEQGAEQLLKLDEVETLLESKSLIVDACRYTVRRKDTVVPLGKRPVLFALAYTLGRAWPEDVTRARLIERAFGSTHVDDSFRLRLRVEIGRLRKKIRTLAEVEATKEGYKLIPRTAEKLVVLAPPREEEHAAVLALLADGQSWSSSALALALCTSQRSVQRALSALAESGKVQALGAGRARRWMTPPVPGFPTTLLLPVPLQIV
jgi:hypothetical protein